MNRFRIPLSDKYDKWYKNPFIRLVILAAILIVMIIVCVSVLGNKSGETGTGETAAVEQVSGDAGSGENLNGASLINEEIQADANQQSAQNAAEASAVSAAEAAGAADAAGTDAAGQMPEGTVLPEAEDGTGAAGVMQLTGEMLESSVDTGWHYTHKGMWYSMAPGLCYYNGWQSVDDQMYHFDAEGYRNVGWTRIGGQAYCFDGQGVYQPDASSEKMVAFTFDDGPSQGMDQIIDLCNETGARVTFFMIGAQVENGGNVIPNIMLAHCELGNHSYTHSNMDTKTPQECADDFAKCDEFIRGFSFGPESDVVRFPYGNVSEEKAQAVGKPCILWDIDSLDWESQDASAIIDAVHSQLSDGNIILMHDRYDATVEACRQLFPELIANGYQLVTVRELSVAKGVEMEPGGIYYNF